jgi:hypothetical protein
VYGLVAPPLIAVIRQLREKSRTYQKNPNNNTTKKKKKNIFPTPKKKAVRNV